MNIIDNVQPVEKKYIPVDTLPRSTEMVVGVAGLAQTVAHIRMLAGRVLLVGNVPVGLQLLHMDIHMAGCTTTLSIHITATKDAHVVLMKYGLVLQHLNMDPNLILHAHSAGIMTMK